MDSKQDKKQDVKQPAPKADAKPFEKTQTEAKDAASISAKPATHRVRLKPGATLMVAEGRKAVRKVGGDWIEMSASDFDTPRLRAMVETEKDIEEAAKPARQQAEEQLARRALFDRFVNSDVQAAAREKAARAPLLEALTPQGPAPAPELLG